MNELTKLKDRVKAGYLPTVGNHLYQARETMEEAISICNAELDNLHAEDADEARQEYLDEVISDIEDYMQDLECILESIQSAWDDNEDEL